MDDDASDLIRPGITGFGAGFDPRWSLATFRAACHAAARMAAPARLDVCEGPDAGRNHYRARIEHPDRPLFLLLNAIVPLLAFARAEEPLRYRFVDAPALAAGFFGPHEPIAAARLEAAIDPQALARRLTGHEREQARYWRPDRVGDLIYNFWD